MRRRCSLTTKDMAASTLVKSSCVVFGVFLILVLFSKLSMTESLTGAYGRKQAESVCRATMKHAAFLSEASEQDDSLILALMHACEARAATQASKDLADKMGVALGNDHLAMLEEQQDRIDDICATLVDAGV